jgi:predicted DCC family thiol-disulfide oxidoreductase YuxK
MMTMSANAPVVLFDGVCNLCNGAVQFILDHDRTHALRFASLQSGGGRALLVEHGVRVPEGDPDTIVVIEGDRVYERSSAALRIARHLTFPFSAMRVFVIVPRPLRDLVYRFIAHNRYRWFGRTNECRIPTPELRARMVG